EQVERLACSRLRLGGIELEPYDYVESVAEGVVRLAARALVTEADLEAISRLAGPLEGGRGGISEAPRQMRLGGYGGGNCGEGLAVVLACEDVREPRVSVAGFDSPLVADLEDLIELVSVDREELRRRRHARRHVANVDGWDLSI